MIRVIVSSWAGYAGGVNAHVEENASATATVHGLVREIRAALEEAFGPEQAIAVEVHRPMPEAYTVDTAGLSPADINLAYSVVQRVYRARGVEGG